MWLNDFGLDIRCVRIRPFIMKDEELFHIDGKTYAFSNQWGVTTLEAVDALKTAFPELDINYERAEQA